MGIIDKKQQLLGYTHEIQKMLAEYRLRRVVDYIQYNNPRYVFSQMSRDLDIPLSTILRYMEKLRSPNIRFRADFNIGDLDLKLVVLKFKGKSLSKHEIEKLPYRHWIAAAINDTTNSSLIMYRIPLIMDEADIIEDTILKLRVSQNLEYRQILSMSMLAKPSFTYYMNYAPLDPINAIEVNDNHPIVSRYIDYNELVKTRQRTSLSIVKDKIDLFGLAVAEFNVLDLEEKLEAYFKMIRKTRRLMKNIKTHIEHISSIIRGNRMISLNRGNLKMIIVGRARTGCLENLGQRMLTYLYTYSIAVNPETGGYVISFDVPPGRGSGVTRAYVGTIVNYVNSLCSNSVIDTIIYNSRSVVEYFTIPFQNYDYIAKTWIIDNSILERYLNKWRKNGLIFYLL
ncbi:MAG: hypothetical protein F7C08_00815 [Desulfurococcales archaeon]|nr:hypothetical protein [Desulfurococcales archaeon]MCE4605065.1 hypothetical protein [Desulfurococcales archaeon]